MALDQAAQRYLAGQTRGRLATVGLDGIPQNKPVGFVYNAELGTLDIAGFNMDTSAKYRNVGVNPNVAFVVDDAVSEGAAGMRFIEIRGQAEQVSVEPPAGGLSPHIIRIHARRVIGMNIDPDHPGSPARDVGTTLDESGAGRPSLGTVGAAAQRAGTSTTPTSPTATSQMTSCGAAPSVPRSTATNSYTPSMSASSGRRAGARRRVMRSCGSFLP
jgi:pyridoxamine 5'-phosphate oxidase family protein